MNNRFLFRCWDPNKKEMHFTSHLSNSYLWELPNAPVMQCTGLVDRNNREIYEGDIVDKGYCQDRAIIVWRDGMYFTKEIGMSENIFLHECVHTNEECMTFLCQRRAEDMLIIGNKYENEEFLMECICNACSLDQQKTDSCPKWVDEKLMSLLQNDNEHLREKLRNLEKVADNLRHKVAYNKTLNTD